MDINRVRIYLGHTSQYGGAIYIGLVKIAQVATIDPATMSKRVQPVRLYWILAFTLSRFANS